MKKIISIIGTISQLSTWISYAAIIVMTFFIFSDVILRSFGRPISGSNDVVQVLSVVIVAFAMGYTHLKKRNPTITLLLTRLPNRVQKIINILTTTCSTFLFVLLTWRTIILAREMSFHHEGTMTLGIPNFPFIYAIAFGSTLITLVSIIDLLTTIFPKDINT